MVCEAGVYLPIDIMTLLLTFETGDKLSERDGQGDRPRNPIHS